MADEKKRVMLHVVSDGTPANVQITDDVGKVIPNAYRAVIDLAADKLPKIRVWAYYPHCDVKGEGEVIYCCPQCHAELKQIDKPNDG